MIFIGGWIYEAVKDAIRDAVPGAIKDALDWHTDVWEDVKDIDVKRFTGKFIAVPTGKIEAKIMTDCSAPELAQPIKLEKVYEIERVSIKKTYRDRYRFNPVTGNTDHIADTNPIVEVMQRQKLKESL